MKRAFDPITTTFFLAVAGIVCLLYYWKMKSVLWLGAAGALFLWAMLRAYQIKENKGGTYSGKVTNESEDTASCLLSEISTGGTTLIGPGVTMDADGVNTGFRADKVYKLRNGTHVRITKKGNVRAYSPISEFVNPGWVDMEYFDKRKALTEEWKQLFNCN